MREQTSQCTPQIHVLVSPLIIRASENACGKNGKLVRAILKSFKMEGEIDQKNSCEEDRSVNRISHRIVDSKMEGKGRDPTTGASKN